MRSFPVMFAFPSVLMIGEPARGQDPPTVEGARAAVVATLHRQGRPLEPGRVVADSAELWERFVVCSNRRVMTTCALADSLPIVMVRIQLTAPDTAQVEIADVELLRTICGFRAPLPAPVIGAQRRSFQTMAYIKGRWVLAKSGGHIAC